MHRKIRHEGYGKTDEGVIMVWGKWGMNGKRK